MIAQVIPYSRTIRGKDSFDYQVPDGFKVEPGSLVWINFRSKKTLGLVLKIKKQSAFNNLKNIIGIVNSNEWKKEGRLGLLQWFSEYYFISLPHAFKSIQRPFLSRPRTIDNIFFQTSAAPKIKKNQKHDNEQFSVVHYYNRAQCIYYYQQLIDSTDANILIIVPEYVDVYKIAKSLRNCYITTWKNEPNNSQYYTLTEDLRNNKQSKRVVIGTKKMCFLAVDLFDYVILDQEHEKAHKQYNMNPRYHARDVLIKSIELCGNSQTKLVITSHAPSLYAKKYIDEKKFAYLDIRKQSKKHDIPVIVDMQNEIKNKNYTWFSTQLIEKMNKANRSFVFFNRIGDYRINICTKCGSMYKQSVNKCEQCGSFNLKLAGKGVQTLERELSQQIKDKKILRIDSTLDDDELEKVLAQPADIIIGTEKVFRVFNISEFDLVAVLTVDNLLTYPDFRAFERVFQLLSYLTKESKNLILQTYSPKNSIIKLATADDYKSFVENEMGVRKMLSLPPYQQLFTLIDKKNKKNSQRVKELDIDALNPNIIVDRQ